MIANKKSNMSAFLVGLVVFIVALIILITFYARTFDIFKSKEDRNICAAEVRVQAALKIGGSDIIGALFKSPSESLSDISCPIIYDEIEGDERYLGYKEDVDDNIKQQVMQNMCECYNTFGEGELELFEAKIQKQKYCVICHNIQFEGDASGRQLINFLDYMADNDCTVRGRNVNAMAYLSGFTTDPERFREEREKHETLKNNVDTIDTNSEYATMFLYTKKGFIHKIWASALGTSGGFLTGALVGILVLTPEPTGLTKAAAIGLASGSVGAVAGGTAGYELGSDESATWDSMTWLYPFEENALKALDCEYLPALQNEN
jgi:hypothetical protein